MGLMDASGLWSFVNSIYFQIRKIQATNQHIFGEKVYFCVGQDF